MRKESISGLSELTGFDRRTIKARLANVDREEQGKSFLFKTTDALAVLYGASRSEDLDYQEERARLTHHQANKTELEEQVLRGELIPSSEIESLLSNIFTAFRAKLLGLPVKASPQLVIMADVVDAENLLRKFIYEALEELSSYDLSEIAFNAAGPKPNNTDTATGNNGKPVGRQGAKTKQRGKRGARKVEH
tara:strand:- start:366 stop:941 length:576 start_codon:yes stop_codon:yes gene_type:complete